MARPSLVLGTLLPGIPLPGIPLPDTRLPDTPARRRPVPDRRPAVPARLQVPGVRDPARVGRVPLPVPVVPDLRPAQAVLARTRA